MTPSTNGHGSPVLRQALAYLDAGLSILPVARDGSKAPDWSLLPRVLGDDGRSHPKWEPFQEQLPARADVERWFRQSRPPGIGVIGGAVSGALETLDFDAEAEVVFPAWCELVEAEVPGLVARLSVARTPKPGFHVRYRCPDIDIPGNDKLARDPKVGDLIETRGHGGYAVAPGSPAECHRSGRLYEHHSGPELHHVQAIGIEEREVLIRAARSFDRGTPQEPARAATAPGAGLSPGDDYDQRGPDWPAILEPYGWAVAHQRGPATYWRRPGKDGPGWSATTGVCTSKTGRQLLAVFSSNAAPFPGPEGGRTCSVHGKFATYALLCHDGNFKVAAKALAEQGYGEQRWAPPTPRPQPSTNGTGRAPQPPADAGPAPESGGWHLTDLGNARRVVARHGADLRYVHPRKAWFVWDGRRWAEDLTAEAVRRVKDAQAELYRRTADRIRDLGDVGDDADRKAQLAALTATLKHALKWEDANRIGACLELARSEPGVPALPEELDRDPRLLTVLNGTIDLRTGELRPHRREDLITKLAPVNYDAAAACPRWLKFLDRVMDGNKAIITYLQRVVGYCLTADVSEQCLWFFHGGGANGKSTFIGTVLAMLGDYGMQAAGDLLIAKNYESHTTDRADLIGRRFVATVETEEGRRLAEALMKQVTGGDKIRARRMRENNFEFVPTVKIVLAASHKPVVRGTDHAVWRRIKLVPWAQTIPDEEKDKALPEKLKVEVPGILAWAVRGCLDWQREGLAEPDEVRQATAEYQADQDVLSKFLAECCLRVTEARAKVSALFDAYARWSGDKFTTQPTFNERLRAKGFADKRTKRGYFWQGLALAEAGEEGMGEPG